MPKATTMETDTPVPPRGPRFTLFAKITGTIFTTLILALLLAPLVWAVRMAWGWALG